MILADIVTATYQLCRQTMPACTSLGLGNSLRKLGYIRPNVTFDMIMNVEYFS